MVCGKWCNTLRVFDSTSDKVNSISSTGTNTGEVDVSIFLACAYKIKLGATSDLHSQQKFSVSERRAEIV